MTYLSPLRYPGGKARLRHLLAEVISMSMSRCALYVEPFAGGAGAALGLLDAGIVDEVLINDVDPGIAALWRSIFNCPDGFVDLIWDTEVSLDSWHEQRQIADDDSAGELERGYATFFLNRTNRSGILGARPIGGLNQTGKWKLDCRFNKKELSDRILYLRKFRDRVHILEEDALVLLDMTICRSPATFIYADPPYISKSSNLYLDNLTWDDHLRLATILNSKNTGWVLTYDVDERVTLELYPDRRSARIRIRHSALRTHVGEEIIVFSDFCAKPSVATLSGRHLVWNQNSYQLSDDSQTVIA